MVKKTKIKSTTTGLVIQIVNAKPKVYEVVRKLAEKEGRSIARQAEMMLMDIIEVRGYK
jgi:hypothetical protein